MQCNGRVPTGGQVKTGVQVKGCPRGVALKPPQKTNSVIRSMCKDMWLNQHVKRWDEIIVEGNVIKSMYRDMGRKHCGKKCV